MTYDELVAQNRELREKLWALIEELPNTRQLLIAREDALATLEKESA